MSEHTKGEWFLDFDIISTEPKRQGKIIASIVFGQVGAKEAKANARLIAAAPDLLEACNDFLKGWLHFCDCIDFGKSNLDAEAIKFMNEVPGKIEQATKL